MAQVILDIREAEGRLPEVCMRCGEAATDTVRRNMSWTPPWIIFIIFVAWPAYLVLALIMTKRAQVHVPLCDQHRWHWFNRNLIMGGSFGVLALIAAGAFVLAINLRPPEADRIMPFVCLGTFVLGLGWLILVIICQKTAIRPTEITDDEVTLTGVSEAFIEALEDKRVTRRQMRRERDRERYDDRYDDEDAPRRRRTPPSDAIEE